VFLPTLSLRSGRKTLFPRLCACVILPKKHLLDHWCRSGGAYLNQDATCDFSSAPSDKSIAHLVAVLPIVKEYTTGKSAANLIESVKDLKTLSVQLEVLIVLRYHEGIIGQEEGQSQGG
jgi:hypothetical protein